MSELIEWEHVGGGDYRGKVGGRILAVILENPPSSIFYVSLFSDGDMEPTSTFKEAKAKAEELLAAWLKEAGLIVKPVKCDKCGGSGKLPEYLGCVDCGHCTVDNMLEAEFCNPTCPCTKDPHSRFNFIKNGE